MLYGFDGSGACTEGCWKKSCGRAATVRAPHGRSEAEERPRESEREQVWNKSKVVAGFPPSPLADGTPNQAIPCDERDQAYLGAPPPPRCSRGITTFV